MNKSMLRFAAALGVLAIVAAPAGAATKKTTKTTKKKATASTVAPTAAPSTAAPTTAAPTVAVPAGAAKPSGSTIKVGLLSAETGNASSAYKNAPAVAKVWEKWVNAEMGGVGGHPVEVVTADDKNTAVEAQAQAKDLIENKGIVGIVLQDSTAEAALVSYIGEKKFPVIGGSANNASAGIGHGQSPYYFMTATGGNGAGESPVVIANVLGQKPYTAAVCAEVAACAAGAKLAELKAAAIGLPYAGVLTVLGSAPNYTAECLEIQSRVAAYSRTAGFVSIGLAPTAMARLINDCVRQGYQGYFGASANTASEAILDTIKVDGLRMGGYTNGFPWWSTAAPVKNFRDAMAKYDKKAEYRDPTSTSTWAALELFRKAMAKAPATVTKDDVLNAYWDIKGETLDGLLPGPVTYTQGKPSTLLQCFWPFKYEKKTFSTLTIDAANKGNGASGDLKSYCAG